MADSARDTSEAVRRTIERDAAIRKGLARGLLNVRALARYIQRAEDESYSLDALISAIRRYPVRESSAMHASVAKLITKLTMKNKIVAVTMKNAPEIPTLLAAFSGEIDTARGENLQIVSGVDSVSVFIDSKNLGKLTAAIPSKHMMRTLTGLAEIRVALTDAALTTPGIIGVLGTELSMNDVNIYYVLSYGPPHSFLFVIDEKDALSAYQALDRLGRAEP